ncbi:hypothetical protein SLE2022_223040 [Rubroshorea leprosula]
MGSSGKRSKRGKFSCCFFFLNIFKSWKPSHDTTDDEAAPKGGREYEGISEWEVEPGINRKASDFIKKFHEAQK